MSKYDKIIAWVFEKNHVAGSEIVQFDRDDLVEACDSLNFNRIKNLGDITYSYRFRKPLPETVRETAPTDCEWIILGAGQAKYEFRLANPGKVSPNQAGIIIDIPDATPQIVRQYAPGRDEQALLTRIRYNRLVDTFSGLTCYSVQNHLRTNVKDVGQIEVDEIYIGIDKKGCHFVLPCQAKSPGDQFGLAQVQQDIKLCAQNYPSAKCRPIALQFLDDNEVAVIEFSITKTEERYSLNIVEEKHYRFTN